MIKTKLKKLNITMAISAFVCVAFSIILVALTWLYGLKEYQGYINSLPENQKVGHALGLMVIVIIWLLGTAVPVINVIPQIILALNCLRCANSLDRTRRRAVTLALLCILDVLGTAVAFMIAGTLSFLRFPIFYIIAVILALIACFKGGLSAYIIAKWKTFSAQLASIEE